MLESTNNFVLSVYGSSHNCFSHERTGWRIFGFPHATVWPVVASPPPLSVGDKGLTDCLVHTDSISSPGFLYFCGDAHKCGGGGATFRPGH